LLSQEYVISKDILILKTWFANPLIRFGAVALLILGLVLVIPGTRAMAGELLNLFRVQQVRVIPIDFTGLEQLTGDGALGNQFTQLISGSMLMDQKPGDPVEAESAEQASQMAGFNVRLPSGKTPSQIYVSDGATFRLILDRTKTQSMLAGAGRNDLVLPESLDGSDISVEIPMSASVAFGTCPKPGASGIVSEESTVASRYPDCVMLVEIPSPTVKAPANLDIDGLARIGLEFTGMSPEETAAFTGTVDWTSTLVIPIPNDATTYRQVSVDGVTGTLIQRPADDPTAKYALLWFKDGIIHAIAGRGNNADQALEIANSLP
jgi:hypothetical protein